MDMNSVTTLISSVGFPIFACCAMGWYTYNQSKLHREEMKTITEALNNNTLALQKLTDKMEDLENEIN